MVSVYAEKKLQSSFSGVPYAIAAAIFLVIGVSAFVSFLASALGAGPSGYDLDDGIVALVAFVVPGAYFAYRWRAERAKRNLFKSYVFAIDDVETPLIDLAALVGRSLNETDRDLRELIGGRVRRPWQLYVRALSGNGGEGVRWSRPFASCQRDDGGRLAPSCKRAKNVQTP